VFEVHWDNFHGKYLWLINLKAISFIISTNYGFELRILKLINKLIHHELPIILINFWNVPEG